MRRRDLAVRLEGRSPTACSGLAIGGIYHGTYLLGLAVQWELIVTGLVLIGTVIVDAFSRRDSTRGVIPGRIGGP